jgi:hypothetical protein
MRILLRTPEIELNATAGVLFKGRYKVQVVEGRGTSERIVRELPWMDNLVLNSGKNYFFTNDVNLIRYAAKGTDNTAPAVTQTQLGAQVGARSDAAVGPDAVVEDPATATATITRTIDFPDETSPQNYNEAGWSPFDTGPLFSRVVFPATVTVLAGQRLRLQYSVTSSLSPTVVTPSSPTITGWNAAGDLRIRSWSAATTSRVGLTSAGIAATGRAYAAITFNTWPTAATVSDLTSNPFPNSDSEAAYTPGTFYRDMTLVWDPGWATGEWAGFGFGPSNLWVHKFTVPQTKADTHRVTINYRVALL